MSTSVAPPAPKTTQVLILAGSIFPGIVLLVALAVPQLVLFLVLRRWLPKVNRDPIEDE